MKAGEDSNGSGARKRTLSAATAQYTPTKPFGSCMLRCDHVLLMVQQIFRCASFNNDFDIWNEGCGECARADGDAKQTIS